MSSSRSLPDVRHRKAGRRTVEIDLHVDKAAAVHANEVPQLEPAAIVGLAANWTGCARLRFDQTKVVEQIIIGAAMAMTALAAAHRLALGVDDQRLGELGTALSFVWPDEAVDARLFRRRLSRGAQLLTPGFGLPLIRVTRRREDDAIDVLADILGNRAPRHVGCHAGGIAKDRIPISAAALPAVVPDVAGEDRAAYVLAAQPLELSRDRQQAIGQRQAFFDSGLYVGVDDAGD